MALPEWVSVAPPAPSEQHPRATCARCGKVERLMGPKPDAARALGRFATWHRRCPDPELIRAAVEQAAIDRADNDRREAWFARRRGR